MFSAIVYHDVDSKSVVTRDKKSIKYVNAFLKTKGEEGVLFNCGISHAFLDGVGMGKLLKKDSQYSNQVCSIYPYHQLLAEEKAKIQKKKDRYLPAAFVEEMQTVPSYTLINTEKRGLYPKAFSISQRVYVIQKAETH